MGILQDYREVAYDFRDFTKKRKELGLVWYLYLLITPLALSFLLFWIPAHNMLDYLTEIFERKGG